MGVKESLVTAAWLVWNVFNLTNYNGNISNF